jgi:hypothetical protein
VAVVEMMPSTPAVTVPRAVAALVLLLIRTSETPSPEAKPPPVMVMVLPGMIALAPALTVVGGTVSVACCLLSGFAPAMVTWAE